VREKKKALDENGRSKSRALVAVGGVDKAKVVKTAFRKGGSFQNSSEGGTVHRVKTRKVWKLKSRGGVGRKWGTRTFTLNKKEMAEHLFPNKRVNDEG